MQGNKSTVDGRQSIVGVALTLFAAAGLSLLAAQHTFEEVAAGLKAPDPATRIRAIQILREGNDPKAAAPIAAALADSDDRVRLEAIDAERALFMTRPVARKKMIGFVVEVRTTDVGVQAFAAGQLALLPRIVPPAVVSGLAAALRDASPRVRLDALYVFGALAPLGGPAASEGLRSGMAWTIEALRRGNRSEQVAAAAVAGRALNDCGVKNDATEGVAALCAETGNALVETVNSKDADVRRAAMRALGQLRYPNAAQALADQLSYYQRGPDAAAALEGLAGIGHETSTSIFERLLTSSSAEMRRLAVEGLARAGTRDSLPGLEKMGQSERSNEVLLALHYAALKLGAPLNNVKPDQLVASLRDSALRPFALQYLLDLSRSIGPSLAGSLQDQDPDTRRLVADILGFSRDPNVIGALEAAAKDPDADTARAAQRAIDRIKLAP
jgi:HEAT repeat protein